MSRFRERDAEKSWGREDVRKREGRQEHGVGDSHPKELVRNEIYHRVLSVLQPVVSLKPVFSMVFFLASSRLVPI